MSKKEKQETKISEAQVVETSDADAVVQQKETSAGSQQESEQYQQNADLQQEDSAAAAEPKPRTSAEQKQNKAQELSQSLFDKVSEGHYDKGKAHLAELDYTDLNYGKAVKNTTLFIRRADVKNEELPQEVKDSATWNLGSVFKNGSPIKGLSRKEEHVLLPEIITSAPGSNEYTVELKNYWLNKSIPIKGGQGIPLKVGKDEDGNVVPIEGHIRDYIDYKFAVNHPEVAESKEKMRSNPLKFYYIYDPDVERSAKNAQVQVNKNAAIKFAEIVQDEEWTDAILWNMLHRLEGNIPSKMGIEDKQNYLYDIVQYHPEEFLELAKDQDLITKAEIEDMVMSGVLERDGTVYYYNTDIIGSDKDKVVAFFKDPVNSKTVQTLRYKLADWKQKM